MVRIMGSFGSWTEALEPAFARDAGRIADDATEMARYIEAPVGCPFDVPNRLVSIVAGTRRRRVG
ncbi:MAG: hypothetical protein LC808_21565 [Actinobacteria bacterium]|nr:hypothetical protein [Actinomycetota bacterium]